MCESEGYSRRSCCAGCGRWRTAVGPDALARGRVTVLGTHRLVRPLTAFDVLGESDKEDEADKEEGAVNRPGVSGDL